MMTMKIHYKDVIVTNTGKVYRQNGTEIIGSRIGKKGHVVMTIGGKTVYLARLVYCLFNDLEYDFFTYRIRYIGDYGDCSLSNIFAVEKTDRKQSEKRKHIDSWKIRELFCSGLSLSEITDFTGVNEFRVKQICLGFENVDMEKFAKIRQMIIDN